MVFLARMSGNQPYGGRESRRVRREQARQLAKELLKAQRESTPRTKRYGSDLFWAFVLLLVHIPWTYIIPEERPWSIAVAWVLWACAFFFLARVFLRWSLDRSWPRVARLGTTAVASVTLLYFGASSIWLVMQPVYLYVAPTPDLIEGERRAFFVIHEGPRTPSNVEVELRDNKSGVAQVAKFAEIDATRSNLITPQYFWFAPSTPWDEDYTITIASSGNPQGVQHLIVRSTHKVLQYAVQVSVDGLSRPVIQCRDSLLPTSYHIAENSKQSCDRWMKIPPEVEDRLQPPPHTVQLPNGSVTIMRVETPTPQAGSESLPDTRHLSEWQRSQIEAELSKYPGHKILIMASSGGNTWSYAQEFKKVFTSARWRVIGPNRADPFYESMIDVQLSANESPDVMKPEITAIRDGFTKAAIKHRQNVMLDPEVSDDVVLWVGAKSPEGVSPDDCAPFSFKHKAGDAKPCAFIRVSKRPLPLPPP